MKGLSKMGAIPKRYAVKGMRLGSRIYTPSGFVLNGAIAEDNHDAIKYLREVGYMLVRCAGIPKRKMSEEELEQMAAADKMLGRHRSASGTTQLERDIANNVAESVGSYGMYDLLAPLRNALRRTFFQKRRL